MAADIAIVAVGMVAASQPGIASETIAPAPSQTEAATLEQVQASPELAQLPSNSTPQLDPASDAIALVPEFSTAPEPVQPTALQPTTSPIAHLAEVEAAETQLINAQLGQAPIALPVAPEVATPEVATPEMAAIAPPPPITPAVEQTAPPSHSPSVYHLQPAVQTEIAADSPGRYPTPPPQPRTAIAQPYAIAPPIPATTPQNLYQQEARALQQQARGLTRNIPVPDAIVLAKTDSSTSPNRTPNPSQLQFNRNPQQAIASLEAQRIAYQRQRAVAIPRPPSNLAVAKTTQANPRAISIERQILAQVMMESAEAQFLEASGLGNAGRAEASSRPASGSGVINGFSDDLGQVTSVSQLRDVQPTDWAYQASQSLVERYGCVSGYPDGTFRGDRSLSRYEFAAGLNACLERVTELLPIAGAEGDFAVREDLAVAQQLAEQFEVELGQVRDRTMSLEQRQADLEAQQFSTTTRLYGQTIFGLRGSNNNDVDLFPVDGVPERSGAGEVSLGGSAELTLASSFRGNDLLLTSLQAGNIAATASTQFTNMGRLSYEGDTDNQLVLSDLSYRFSATPSLGLVVGAVGVNPTNTFRGISPLEGSGDGALSRLGQRNPILELGAGTGGAGFDWQLSRNVSLQGVYSATSPNQAGNDVGLFNGGYVAGGQVSAGLGRQADLGLHYLHSYSPNGSLGTGIGDAQVLSPFATDSSSFRTHAVGASAAWRASRKLILGGWGGWTSSTPTSLSGTVQTTNWMGFAQVNDLFRQGSALGLLVGQPPKITSSNLPVGFNFPEFSDGGGRGGREDTALHLEAFYRAQLNENISLTPGIVVVRNPNHNADNDTLVVGAMRTTFRF